MTASDKAAVDHYFHLHRQIQHALEQEDYVRAAHLTKESLPLIPHLVRDTIKQFGHFDILESLAVHTGGKVLAALGDVPALEHMYRALSAIPDTQAWAIYAKERLDDSALAEQILSYIDNAPGILQSSLKNALSSVDPQRISEICYWLARIGRLRREKRGRSYVLFRP